MSAKAVQFHYAARSDVGLVRSNNQDSGYAGANLLVLADGMGGPAGGDIASSVALAHLVPLDTDSHPADSMLPLLREALLDAHEELTDRSSRDRDLEGLGTTCIALMRSGNRLAMVHIGDSRAYVVGGGGIRQLTHDHSALQEARDLAATSGAPRVIPPANVVTKALGAGQSGSVKADYTIMPLEEGDRAVICTDGVHGVLQDAQIHAIVAAGDGPQGSADALVQASLETGTRDNTTAVVVYAGTESRGTLTTNVLNRMIQPVRPASIETARRVPRREGSN